MVRPVEPTERSRILRHLSLARERVPGLNGHPSRASKPETRLTFRWVRQGTGTWFGQVMERCRDLRGIATPEQAGSLAVAARLWPANNSLDRLASCGINSGLLKADRRLSKRSPCQLQSTAPMTA